jgi:hypothetical protein
MRGSERKEIIEIQYNNQVKNKPKRSQL